MKTQMFQSREELERYLGQPRIECLECGRTFRKLGTHLRTIHGMEPDDYREKYGIPYKVGLACPSVREAAAELARSHMTPERAKELWLASDVKRKAMPHRRMSEAPIIRAFDAANTAKMRAIMLAKEREIGPSERKREAAIRNAAKATSLTLERGPTERYSAASRRLGKLWGPTNVKKMLAAAGKKKLELSAEQLAAIHAERRGGASLSQLSRKHGISWSSMQRLCASVVSDVAA